MLLKILKLFDQTQYFLEKEIQNQICFRKTDTRMEQSFLFNMIYESFVV